MKGIDTFISPNNFTILVGKNSRMNDVLTFEVAQLEHTWLHVRDEPGAHVVIQGTDIPKEDLYYAAKLAAQHSKASSGVVGVDMCCVADVSKPKCAPHGQVEIKNEVTIYVRK